MIPESEDHSGSGDMPSWVLRTKLEARLDPLGKNLPFPPRSNPAPAEAADTLSGRWNQATSASEFLEYCRNLKLDLPDLYHAGLNHVNYRLVCEFRRIEPEIEKAWEYYSDFCRLHEISLRGSIHSAYRLSMAYSDQLLIEDHLTKLAERRLRHLIEIHDILLRRQGSSPPRIRPEAVLLEKVLAVLKSRILQKLRLYCLPNDVFPMITQDGTRSGTEAVGAIEISASLKMLESEYDF